MNILNKFSQSVTAHAQWKWKLALSWGHLACANQTKFLDSAAVQQGNVASADLMSQNRRQEVPGRSEKAIFSSVQLALSDQSSQLE